MVDEFDLLDLCGRDNLLSDDDSDENDDDGNDGNDDGDDDNSDGSVANSGIARRNLLSLYWGD